jgi:hypothetical protein
MKISAFRCCFSFLLCGFKQKFFSFKREKFFSFICPRKADVRKSRSGLQIRKVPAKSKITKTQSKKSRNQQEKTSAPAFRIFLVRTFPYSWTETRAVRQGKALRREEGIDTRQELTLSNIQAEVERPDTRQDFIQAEVEHPGGRGRGAPGPE